MVDVSVNFTLEEQETYNAEFVVTPDVTYVADMKVLTGTRDHTELYNRDVANQHPMSAITGLEGALSNEATARENADTQLQNNIDAEVLRATTAENNLNTKIEAETLRAESVESQLSDDIVAENTRALSAEETLQDNINTEETRAKGVENQLRNDLTAETTRASTAEEGLQSAINTEKSRAEDAENALRVDLEELETSINDDISDLNNKIEAETSRAETAETTLTTNLNSEISTRVSEISRVEGLIAAEEERATNVESDLQSDISSEASTRASEITRVEGLISAETSRATGIENTLRDDLTLEITARQNADTALQNSITAEATARSNADTTLQNNINTLTTTVSSNYTTLDNKITNETTNRESADNNLQSQIDAITASSDVTDIVGTYAQLQTYDTSTLAPNSIIKVLQDENRNNETTYYRWVITGGVGSWVLIGEEGPYYTKSEADSAFVPQSRTINGQALSANVTLTASDVGATTQSYVDTELLTKQDVISDLATIRTNATNGASAYTTIQNYGNIVTHNVSEFATSAQGALADTAVQPSDLATVATSGNYNDLSNKPTIPTVPTNVSAFTNDAGYITSSALNGYATENWVNNQGYLTGITSSDVTTALGYTPYNATNPNGYITNSALTPYVLSADLASVATSGSYDDLINKPTIPSAVTEATVSGWGFTKNTGTVTSVNNVSPVNGNVTLSIPTVPTNLLKNTATASSALTISGIATDERGAINIGASSEATGSYGVSIGSFSYANGFLALGLGYSARATADYAIQLGQGTNSTASTLYVGFNNSNYLLLDGTTGLIPDARLSSNILRSADLSGYATENWVNNQGYLTGITSSDVTTALGYTPYNATNPNGYITSSALSGYALDADVVHLTGTQSISGTKTFLAKTNMAPIELYPVDSGSPYIDFHYSNSTSDYTSRIIEQASGDLVVTANNFTINANGYARASDVNGSILTTVNKSKATDGYFQLGNGMIVNWGSVSSWTSNAAQVTFSKAFTTTRQIAIARSAGAATTNDGGDYFVRGISNTGFNMYRTSTNTGGVSWIAIGY